jgi:hypothetical protein
MKARALVPLRYKGSRYEAGQILEIDEESFDLVKNLVEIIEKIKEDNNANTKRKQKSENSANTSTDFS